MNCIIEKLNQLYFSTSSPSLSSCVYSSHLHLQYPIPTIPYINLHILYLNNVSNPKLPSLNISDQLFTKCTYLL